MLQLEVLILKQASMRITHSSNRGVSRFCKGVSGLRLSQAAKNHKTACACAMRGISKYTTVGSVTVTTLQFLPATPPATNLEGFPVDGLPAHAVAQSDVPRLRHETCAAAVQLQ